MHFLHSNVQRFINSAGEPLNVWLVLLIKWNASEDTIRQGPTVKNRILLCEIFALHKCKSDTDVLWESHREFLYLTIAALLCCFASLESVCLSLQRHLQPHSRDAALKINPLQSHCFLSVNQVPDHFPRYHTMTRWCCGVVWYRFCKSLIHRTTDLEKTAVSNDSYIRAICIGVQW